MTNTTRKYIGFLALAFIGFYWKTILTGQFSLVIGSEGVNQVYGWLHFWARSVRHWHIPLWDPYAWGGRPFSGEMQTAAYYPFRLIFALFPLNSQGLISVRLFHFYLAFTHFLSGCFMFALLRELRRSHYASMIGAFAFAMGGMMVRFSWPHYLESCIWFPLVFFCLLRAWRSGSAIWAALGGLCMGLSALTGGIQFTMLQGIVVITAAAWRIFADREPARSALRPVAWIVLIAALVGAAQLVPAMEYSRLTLRSITGGWFPMSEKIPYDRLDPGMWPESLITLFMPNGFDGNIGGGEAYPFYFGVLPAAFAILAAWKCRADLWVRYMVGLVVVTFLYMLGEFSPLHGLIYAVVPFLWVIREPGRFQILIGFAIGVLSAYGVDSLFEERPRDFWAPARPYLKWISIVAALAFALPAVVNRFNPGIWVCFSLLLILASCGWLARLMTGPASPALRLGLTLFILFDLGAFNWIERNWSKPVALAEYGQILTLRKPSQFVQALPGLNRVQVAVSPEPNPGDFWSVQSVWGGGATIFTGFSRLMGHQELLNVRYRIRPASTKDPGAIYQDDHWKVYEDTAGFPRAWVVHQTAAEPSLDAVYARLDKHDVDWHDTAIVESPLPRFDSAPPSGESVNFVSYQPNSMQLSVNSPASGLLVLSEAWYPGWRARVNGRDVEILRAYGALRGIVLPRGANRVELEYVPMNFYIAGAISLITMVAVIAMGVRNRRTLLAE